MVARSVRFYKRYCRVFGPPFMSKASEDLEFSVKFLGWKMDPGYIIGAGKFTVILGFIIIALISSALFFLGLNPVSYFLFSPLVLVLFFVFTEWPKSLAKQAASKSLSKSPYIISQIVVSLKQTPNLENSLSFVSKNNTGRLAREMRNILFDVWAGKAASVHKEIIKTADRWSRFSLGFQRSVHLIASSFYEKEKKSKETTLDMAVSTVLDDIKDSMKSYATSLYTPTLVIFSMGTIFPLMVISLFPIVSFFGFNISQVAIGGFLIFSLLATYLYSDRVLRKKPASFAMPKIKGGQGETDKGLPLLIAVMLSFPTFLFLMGYPFESWGFAGYIIDLIAPYGMVWGIGIGASLYFYRYSAKRRKLRKELQKLESGFTDSLYHIKNRLKDGQPFESAIEFSAGMMEKMPTGKYFSGIVNNMRTRNLTFEEAVKKGETDSVIINSVFGLLINAMKKGRAAVMQTADVVYNYLNMIKEIEKSVNEMLSKTLGMIRATITLFAPVICAIIVVLFQMINNTVQNIGQSNTEYSLGTLFFFFTIRPEVLQIIIGLYLIALNYVLVRYVSHIQNGFDKIAFRYDLARSIPVTLAIFTAALIFSRMALLKA